MELNALFKLCRDNGIKSFIGNPIDLQGIEIEFFPPQPEQMNLDPVALSKVLSDSMPPDSAMLYASTEDVEDPK